MAGRGELASVEARAAVSGLFRDDCRSRRRAHALRLVLPAWGRAGTHRRSRPTPHCGDGYRQLAPGTAGCRSPRSCLLAVVGWPQMTLCDKGCRLGAPLEVQLGKDAADVVLNGLIRKEHVGGDLLVRLPLRDEEEDPALLAGKVGELVGRAARPAPHP